MKPRVTSFDIAFRAGVSQATVSRALRDSPLVSPETRARVQQIARELNYTVDKNASSLRRQRAGTLALLLFEDPTGDESLINPFFMAIIASITRACARHGLDLLMSFQQTSADWHADYQDSHRADGVILLGYGDYLEYRPKLERLVEEGTHFVRWGPAVEDQHGTSICCDNRLGGDLATRHLLDLGRRRIAWIGTATLQCPEFLERYMGHAEALAREGIALQDALRADASDSTEETGYRAMRGLLDRGAAFDAVFAASDLLAIGAMRALADAGRRVPEDVAVVGFDDIPMASFVRPALSTVMQDTRLAGERLVASLLAQIAGEPVVSEVLPPKLVVRRSCGAAAP
jgi:DNA-binding LacI/PurR family transcriptional regulator